ncbi:hypothetical protein [Albidovulum sp.]
MQYEWILDVLSDLKSFATGNGLTELAEQLDDTSLVAAAEIARLGGRAVGDCVLNAEGPGQVSRSASAGDNS